MEKQQLLIKSYTRGILRLVCKTVSTGQSSTRQNNTTQDWTVHDKFL